MAIGPAALLDSDDRPPPRRRGRWWRIEGSLSSPAASPAPRRSGPGRL